MTCRGTYILNNAYDKHKYVFFCTYIQCKKYTLTIIGRENVWQAFIINIIVFSRVCSIGKQLTGP